MAKRDFPLDTQVQKFFEESYNKERDTRLAWYKKQGPRDSGKSKQYEVFRRKIENESKPAETITSKLPKDVREARYNKKITKIDYDLATCDNSNILSAEMRPVTPKTKTRLYEGFTKEGKGRYQYLSSRYQKNPEDKFTFPLLSSWEYGWRLADVIKKDDIRKPKNGRTRIVADTFYTRTGIPNAY